MVIVRCPSFCRSTADRNDRPIKRWISDSRPPVRRPLRPPGVDAGNMLYSAVNHPPPLCTRNEGTLSSTEAAQMTQVLPHLINADPSSGIRKRAKETSRERSLSEMEIRQLWSGLDGSPLSPEMQIALKLILLTGKRTTEIIYGRWSEIQDDWWITPSQKSKTGVMNRTPLLSLSQALIGKLQSLSGHSVWLFPSPWKEEPIRVDSVCRAVHRLRQSLEIPHWTSRDLRRTVATHMGRIGVPDPIIGKVMNHTDGRTTAIYNRHGYNNEKRNALQLWDRELTRIIAKNDQLVQAA